MPGLEQPSAPGFRAPDPLRLATEQHLQTPSGISHYNTQSKNQILAVSWRSESPRAGRPVSSDQAALFPEATKHIQPLS
jgi:hypothetical protein